jgi:protein TonB
MLDIDRRRDPAGRSRAIRATWVSAGLHVLAAVVIGIVTAPRPASDRLEPTARRDPPLVVWLERPGAPGGGGDHGDRTPTPASRAERPGTARLTVPARVAPSRVSRARPEPPPLQEIDIPAVPEASGLREIPGLVSEVTVAVVSTGGPGSGPGAGDGQGDGVDRGSGGHWGGGPRNTGNPASSPELISQVRPNYTSPAMQARVEGLVVMDAVVLPDGTVGDVKIVRSLDRTFGLDEEAIKAVKQWRFRPGRRAGDPIAMLVSVEMMFELR